MNSILRKSIFVAAGLIGVAGLPQVALSADNGARGATTTQGGAASSSGQSGSGSQTGATGGTQGAAQSGQQAGTADHPIVVLLPVAVADPIPNDGCWVQVFEDRKYGGDSVIIAGPREITNMKGLGGYQFGTLGDSIVAGPKASATLYEDENYTGKAVKVTGGQRLDEVSQKFGAFESMESLRVSCSGQKRG